MTSAVHRRWVDDHAAAPARRSVPAASTEDLRRIPALAGVPDADLQVLLSASTEMAVEAGNELDVRTLPAAIVLAGHGDVRLLTPRGPIEMESLKEGDAIAAPQSPDDDLWLVALDRMRLMVVPAAAASAAFTAVREHVEVARFLKLASPLSHVGADHLAAVAAAVRGVEAPAGTVLMTGGVVTNTCMLLRRGRAEVVDVGGVHVRWISPGGLFGEAALLEGLPQPETVRAVEPCTILVLYRDALLDAMRASRPEAVAILALAESDCRPARVPLVDVDRATIAGVATGVLVSPRGAYFRLSALGEYLWTRMDGSRSVRELTLDVFSEMHLLNPGAVAHTVTALAQGGFVTGVDLPPEVLAFVLPLTRVERAERSAHAALEWRYTVDHTDAAVTRLYRGLLWPLATRPMLLLLAGLGIFGMALLPLNGWRTRGGAGVGVVVALVVGFVASVLIHEVGHAVATKAVGRRVPRLGVGWYWFGPVAFVDTSDVWLASRAQRVWVSLAGPLANAGLGGLLAIGAVLLSGTVSAVCWELAAISYFSVLLNLNPLLEYDGYYALADALDRPNMRRTALSWVGSNLRHPGQLWKGHQVDVVYAIGAVAYVVAMAAVVAVVYRATIQSWVSSVLPSAVAQGLTWVLALVVVVLAALNMATAMRGDSGA